MSCELDDLYDDVTLRRLDRAAPTWARRVPSSPRSRLAAGVLAASLLGLRDVLEDDARQREVIEVAPDPGCEPVRGISLYFVPGQPEATVAVVR